MITNNMTAWDAIEEKRRFEAEKRNTKYPIYGNEELSDDYITDLNVNRKISYELSFSYQNGTKKECTIKAGDKVTLSYCKDGKYSEDITGIIKDIRELNNNTILYLDMSTEGNAKLLALQFNSLRTVKNITDDTVNKEYDKDGVLVVS